MKVRKFLGFGALYRLFKKQGIRADIKKNKAQLILHDAYLEIIETISDLVQLEPKFQAYFFNIELSKIDLITPLNSTLESPLLEDGQTIANFLKEMGEESFETLKAAVLNYRMYGRDHSKVENLVFAGGGAKGMAYPGVLSVLDKPINGESGQSLLSTVKAVAGASAGALTAFPLALGMDAKDVEEIVLDNEFGAFFKESQIGKGGIQGAIISYVMKKNMGAEEFGKVKRELEYIKAYCEEFERGYSIVLRSLYNKGASKRNSISLNEFLRTEELVENTDSYAESLKRFRERFVRTSSEIQLRKLISELETTSVSDESSIEFIHERSKSKALEKLLLKGYSPLELENLDPMGAAQDAAKYVLRSSGDKDNIEGFFGDLIEKRLSTIPESVLEDVLPELTIKQDERLYKDIRKGISYISEYIRPILDEVAPYSSSPVFWKRELMSMLRNHDLGEDALMSTTLGKMMSVTKLGSWEAKSVIDSLGEMKPSEVQHLLELCEKDSDYLFRQSIEDFVRDSSIMSYRAGAKRNMNFKHLHKLSSQLPQYGFKELYITMCEDRGMAHALKKGVELKNPLMEKYKLIEASHRHPEFCDMPIKKSARFSMNLPLVFEQLEYKGRYFVDGGVKNNLPKNIFYNKGPKTAQKTMVFMFGEDAYFKKSHNFKRALFDAPVLRLGMTPMEGLKALISKIAAGLHYKKNINYKEISGTDMWKTHIVRSYDVDTTDFLLSKRQKMDLIKKAKASMEKRMSTGIDAQKAFLLSRQEVLIEEYARLHGVEVSEIDMSELEPDERSIKQANKNLEQFARDIHLGLQKTEGGLLTI